MFTYDFTTATDQESQVARQASAKIMPFLQQPETAVLHVNGASPEDSIVLPARALVALNDILAIMAAGKGVAIIPQEAELTTRQAAEILNVSRPHLVKLLDSGEIPCRMVGTHRRIRRDDVMRYKVVLRQKREAILAQMIADAQEWGLYD